MNEEEFINRLITETVSIEILFSFGLTVFNPYIHLEVSRSQSTRDGWMLYCKVRPKQNLYLTDNDQILYVDRLYYCEVASEFAETFRVTAKYVHTLKYFKELNHE